MDVRLRSFLRAHSAGKDEMIPWPPLLLLEGLDNSADSKSKLFQLFGPQSDKCANVPIVQNLQVE